MAQSTVLEPAKVKRRKRRLTEEEFMRLPDDGRKYKLVNGEAKEVPTGGRQGSIGGNILYQLKPLAKGRAII